MHLIWFLLILILAIKNAGPCHSGSSLCADGMLVGSFCMCVYIFLCRKLCTSRFLLVVDVPYCNKSGMFEMIIPCCTYRRDQKCLQNLSENLEGKVQATWEMGCRWEDNIKKIGCGDVIDLTWDIIQYQAVVNMIINQIP
jgi:hypothetical protein